MTDPALPRRSIAIWAAISYLFLGAAALASALLVAPEWLGAGMCEGSCNATTSVTVWWGVALALLAAFLGIVTLAYTVASTLTPDERIDTYMMADVPRRQAVVIPTAVSAAQGRPAPSVFDRWIRA